MGELIESSPATPGGVVPSDLTSLLFPEPVSPGGRVGPRLSPTTQSWRAASLRSCPPWEPLRKAWLGGRLVRMSCPCAGHGFIWVFCCCSPCPRSGDLSGSPAPITTSQRNKDRRQELLGVRREHPYSRSFQVTPNSLSGGVRRRTVQDLEGGLPV